MNARVAMLAMLGIAGLAAACLLLQPLDPPREASPLESSRERPLPLPPPSSALEPRSEAPAAERAPGPRPFSFFGPEESVEDPRQPRLLRGYGAQELEPIDDLLLVRGVLLEFWRLAGNPDQMRLDSNAAILRSLTGGNEAALAFVSPDNGFLDAEGQLLDRWGAPLFFHANSVVDIEIRSSGADGRRYTEDDLVARARGSLP